MNMLVASNDNPTPLKVQELQEAIGELPQVELPVTHHFSAGVYVCEVFHPAGVAVVGYMHRTDHLFLLAKGELTITTDEGMRRIKGPCMLHTHPGMKRVAYAHEDTTIFTIHVTEETDPRKIMDAILVPEAGGSLPSPGTDYLKHPTGELP